MEPNPITALSFTGATLPLLDQVVPKKKHPSSQAKMKSLVANPFQPPFVSNADFPTCGWLQNHSQFYPISSVSPPYLYSNRDRYVSPVPFNSTGRRSPGLLDTKQWGPLPDLAASPVTSGTHFPTAPTMGSEASLDGPFSSDLLYWGAPMHQAIPYSQGIPGLNPTFPRPARQHPSLDTDIVPWSSPGYRSLVHDNDHPISAASNVMSSSSSTASAHDVARFVRDEWQPPPVIYKAPQKKGSGHRRSQRARAINIEGLWIDEDDLYTGTRQNDGMIVVHECAHIRKWHPQGYTGGTVKCLWDGCTSSKGMLRDSINRHVVTIHLEEAFHCLGCSKEFPRKDVYDKHVGEGEACREAGAMIMYGTERRMIDACQALKRGFGGDAVRFSG